MEKGTPVTGVSRSDVIAAALIILVCFIAYSGTLGNGFVHDDHDQVINNPWITHIGNLPAIFFSSVWSFQGDPQAVSNYYRPVMYLFYMVEYHLFGLNPWGWHLVNILLHTMNSIMVFILTRQLFAPLTTPTGREEKGITSPGALFPLAAALLFATHPVNSETVAWVACVPELSFTLFYLLAFSFHLSAREKERQAGEGCTLFSSSLALSLFCFFCAALSKETALTFPLLLLIYDYGSDGYRLSPLLKQYKRYALYGAVVALYFIARLYAMGGMVPRESMHQYLTSFQSFINVFPLFFKYVKTLLLPLHLSHFHVFNPVDTLFSTAALTTLLFALFLLFSVIYLIRAQKKPSHYLFFIALVVIPLLPVFYIPALGKNVFAERYLYLPSFGFIGLLTHFLYRQEGLPTALKLPSRIPAALLVVIVGLYTYGAVQRVPVWINDRSLWEDAVRSDPDNYFAIYKLGNLALNSNRNDEAIEALKRAVEVNARRTHPDLGNAVYSFLNLGEAYRRKGLLDESLAHYKKLLRLAPDFPFANYDIGIVYQQKGLLDEAIASYRRALNFFQKKSDIINSYNRIAYCFALKGEWDKAVENYEQVLRLDSRDPVALGNITIAKSNRRKRTE